MKLFVEFISKGKVEYFKQNILFDKINDNNRCKVLLKSLNMVYGTYLDSRDFIHKSSTDICRNENLPVDHQVFSVCFGFICC